MSAAVTFVTTHQRQLRLTHLNDFTVKALSGVTPESAQLRNLPELRPADENWRHL